MRRNNTKMQIKECNGKKGSEEGREGETIDTLDIYSN
jgi:hypothetical protein